MAGMAGSPSVGRPGSGAMFDCSMAQLLLGGMAILVG